MSGGKNGNGGAKKGETVARGGEIQGLGGEGKESRVNTVYFIHV